MTKYPLAAIVIVILVAVTLIAPWQTFSGAFSHFWESTFLERLLWLKPTLRNFRELFTGSQKWGRFFGRWVVNSLILATCHGLLYASSGTIAGYALARYRFWGHDIVSGLWGLSVIVPSVALYLPNFLVLSKLGFRGLPGMVIPFAFGGGSALMAAQFAKGVNSEILDAARVDGASDWQTLRFIGLPLLKPVFALLFTGAFVGGWSNLIWASIMLKDMNSWITTQGIVFMMTQAKMQEGWLDYGVINAACLLSLIVPVSVFWLLQKPLSQSMEGLIQE